MNGTALPDGTEPTLAERIAREIATGRAALDGCGPAVSIFGGARVPRGHRWFDAARETARKLALAGFAVMTGAGPGIMEAANQGAREAGGVSIGLSVTLLDEPSPNPYVNRRLHFEHLASRKVTFCRHSRAFVFFPGGIGTLDELSEVLTLLATARQAPVPLLFHGEAFWRPGLDWMRDSMAGNGLVEPHLLDAILVTDDPDRLVQCCSTCAFPRSKNGALAGWQSSDER